MMYDLLKENFKEQHTELVRIIREAAPADKIYFLGSTLNTRNTESIFNKEAIISRSIGHYYLLVLIGKEHDCNAAQDKIENNCRHFVPATAIVLHTERFTEWLSEEHVFAYKVVTLSALLYSKDETQFSAGAIPDDTLVRAHNEAVYKQGMNTITEFLAGAEIYHLRHQNKMAAFMLHQAAEHALHTILKMGTGLYVNTHNLDKLIRYCSMVSGKLPDIFSRNNEEEKRLFNLLQKAYVDARYKEEYAISGKDIQTICARVKQVKEILVEFGNAMR